MRIYASLASVTLVIAITGCGGSSAKKGDCVGTATGTTQRGEKIVNTVDCHSSQAKATLVSNGEDPKAAIACPTIAPLSGPEAGADPSHDYNVLVDGKDFCARPK
jgi:hypothetical protein